MGVMGGIGQIGTITMSPLIVLYPSSKPAQNSFFPANSRALAEIANNATENFNIIILVDSGRHCYEFLSVNISL